MKNFVIWAAGHRPKSHPGATRGSLVEADIAVEIINVAMKYLADHGFKNQDLVPHDLNLADEIKWMNARYYGARYLAIEVHKNGAASPLINGVEFWFEDGNGTEQWLSQIFSAKLADLTGLSDRGAKPDTINRHGRLGWNHLRGVDSILGEFGFIGATGDPSPATYGVAIAQAVMDVFGFQTKQPTIGGDNMFSHVPDTNDKDHLASFMGLWAGDGHPGLEDHIGDVWVDVMVPDKAPLTRVVPHIKFPDGSGTQLDTRKLKDGESRRIHVSSGRDGLFRVVLVAEDKRPISAVCKQFLLPPA